MFSTHRDAWTYLRGGLVAASLGLGFSQLCAHFTIDPLGPVRSRSESLQRETMPKDGRVTYREMNGYFPLPPKVEWQFETASDWKDLQTHVKDKLATDFRLLRTTPNYMTLCKHSPGEIEHLAIELLRDDAPTLVRCVYEVSRDPAE